MSPILFIFVILRCSYSVYHIQEILAYIQIKSREAHILPAAYRREELHMECNTKELAAKLLPELELNLSDFALFLSVMKDKTAHECILSIIMGETDLELAEVKVEQVVLNKLGKRAIRLDAWAKDKSLPRQFLTEMQNDTKNDDVRKRSRFYQGMVDVPILKSGKDTRYKELPSTVIIFITQEDIWGKDMVQYTFTEQCKEIPGLELDDGTQKIFLNMKSKNGTPELVSLLQYMKKTDINNPDILIKDNRIIKLDEIVTEVKQSEEWEAVEMNIFQKGQEIGHESGLQKGIELGKQEGIELGTQKGIAALILDNLEEGIGEERILTKLQKRFDLTPEQATEYFEKYSK